MSATVLQVSLWLLLLVLLLWPPYVTEHAIIFLPCDLYLLLSFFPRLISAVGDGMSATHGVALVRI